MHIGARIYAGARARRSNARDGSYLTSVSRLRTSRVIPANAGTEEPPMGIEPTASRLQIGRSAY